MMMSVATLYNSKQYDDRKMMNWRRSGTKQPQPKEDSMQSCVGGIEENHKNLSGHPLF
jgi:hypothetical protein